MNSAILATMAWRNLWKNIRRTFITLFGIAFGVMLAILFTGLQDATWAQTIDLAAKMGTGHVTIQHNKYLDEPSVANFVPNDSKIINRLKRDSRIKDAKGRIIAHGMLATAAQSFGTMVYGLDVESETKETLLFLDGDLRGRWFKQGETNSVVLGATLAKELEVELGQKVVYTLCDKKGEMVSALGRVTGILLTGESTIDKSLCVVEINGLRSLIGLGPNDVTQIAVFLQDYRYSIEVANEYGDGLSKNKMVVALPWQVLNSDLDGLVATKMAASQIFEILLLILIAAGIFNTLFVSVMERIREFGILNAIGFKGCNIFLLVVFESVFLALLGIFLAAVVTIGPYYYLNTVGIDFASLAANGESIEINGIGMATTIYVGIYVNKAVIIILITIGATLLSGLYPAYRASSVEPVKSIRVG